MNLVAFNFVKAKYHGAIVSNFWPMCPEECCSMDCQLSQRSQREIDIAIRSAETTESKIRSAPSKPVLFFFTKAFDKEYFFLV
jgi:hypothetical protein